MRLPPGAPLDVSNEAAGKIEKWLLEQPEVAMVQTNVGSIATSGSSNTANFASVICPLVSKEKRRNVILLAVSYRRDRLVHGSDILRRPIRLLPLRALPPPGHPAAPEGIARKN
ncbi:MAG: hypothetical protein ACLQMF_13035 [Rectinemataceae bacterium]